MKAQVVHELSGIDALRYEEVDPPPCPPGFIRIGVEAIGLNFPDVLVVQGLYQHRPELPFTPGSEAAGTVLGVGEGVTAVAVGDRVMGLHVSGAMAEEFVAPEHMVYRIPDTLPATKAAGISMTYGTAYHALVDRGHLAPGETLLVTGAAGGIGSAAIQVGKALGARVIAAASTEEKAAVAGELGADETVNYATESLRDRVRALTEGKGADVIYDPVGGDVFMETMRCINWGGRILVMGFASGTIPEAPMNLPLLKGCSLVGVFWGEFARRDPVHNRSNFDRLLAWAADGTIDPYVSVTFPLERAGDGLAALASRSAIGKVILTV